MARKKQQGNGSGTVYPHKNKDGKVTSYLGAYYAPDGKRRTVSAKTKSACRYKLRQAMSDADKGMVFNAGTLTVGQYLDTWLLNIKGTVRQRTWERYEQLVRVHIKPALGNFKLKDLTRAHVKNLYGTLKSSRHTHITLHKALSDAVADNLIPRNVSDGLKLWKPRKKEINPLTPEQARAFLEAARGDRYYALYVLAIHYAACDKVNC